MRVTANAFDSSLASQLNLLTSRQYNLQNQISSGLKVAAPSDDPAAMENTLDYQAQNAAQTQYSNNISTLQSRATSVYDVLQSLQTISSRVGEISTLASDQTKSQTDLNNYADEVNQLLSQAVQLANTKDPSTGQYLFGGTASSQAPFTTTTDASGNVTGVTYNGNSSVNRVEIAPGVTTSVDIPGANTSGSGARGLVTDSQSGADLFNHLIALAGDMKSGNAAAIAGADSANLRNDDDHLLYQVSLNGAVQSRLATASTVAANRSQALDTMISNTSSADLVQTMVQLSQAQTAYQAALQSGAKIMQLSILNYL
jgi:flagellar hook-associated protein 3 FlgL